MSALPPIADEWRTFREVRFGPEADEGRMRMLDGHSFVDIDTIALKAAICGLRLRRILSGSTRSGIDFHRFLDALSYPSRCRFEGALKMLVNGPLCDEGSISMAATRSQASTAPSERTSQRFA